MKFLDKAIEVGYDRNVLEKALKLTSSLKQLRKSSGTVAEHRIRVAEILVEHRAAQEMVVAALVYGVDEELIARSIGNKILQFVKDIQSISTLKLRITEAEALRKVLLTTFKDPRVIAVKLATKLDNLRTIEGLPRAIQVMIAREVLDVYAPLANRLGMDLLKQQLEDAAFKVIYPEDFLRIQSYVEASNEQRKKIVESALERIKELAKGHVKLLAIKGRSKHLYSMFKKEKNRGISLRKQFDFYGVRVNVKTIKDCYVLLGLLHQHLEPMPGRLKDYIANPKSNLYQSLHTGVRLENGVLLEVQIRTLEMDELAEEGIAAHWKYKGVKADEDFEKRLGWLKSVLEQDLDSSKVDVFGDRIYCYTPKGDVKELPREATLLDFAFTVHEEVGSKAVGGRVNGKFVPLKYKLHVGDVVEVLTHKNQRPRRGWIKLVSSAKARQRIRKYLKEYELLVPTWYRKLTLVKRDEAATLVKSEDLPNALCVLAKCCCALPGEEIVGIMTKKRLISVHRDDCKLVVDNKQRWVPVQWKKKFGAKLSFVVNAVMRQGVLADVLHTVVRAGFTVAEAKAVPNGKDMRCQFLVVPRGLDDLVKLVIKVKKVQGVQKIFFE